MREWRSFLGYHDHYGVNDGKQRVMPAALDTPAAIIALLQRITLTTDRAAGLQGTLTSWLELDREERRG